MSSTVKLGAAAGALCAMAIIALYLLARDEPRPPSTPLVLTTSAQPAATVVEFAMPTPPTAMRREEAPPAAERPVRKSEPRREPTERADPVALLKGVVVGIAREHPWTTPIRMVAPEGITAVVDADGRFQFDITSLMADEYESVELLADDPSYLPVRKSVSLVDRRGRAFTNDQRPPVRIAVELARSSTARVVDESRCGVPGALIGVFDLGRDGPATTPLTTSVSDQAGNFDLRIAFGRADYLVVAVNTEPHRDLRPVAVEIRWECPMLVMPPGVCIGGFVRKAGVEPLKGAVVQATRVDYLEWLQYTASSSRSAFGRKQLAEIKNRPTFLMLGEHTLLWRKNSIELAITMTATDADGHYCIQGLAVADYQVSVRKLPNLDVHPSLAQTLARTIAAPTDRADLDVVYGIVTVQVTNHRGPLSGIMVHLDTEVAECTRFTDALGEVSLATPPDIRIPLIVGRLNRDARSIDVILTPGNDQQITVSVRLP